MAFGEAIAGVSCMYAGARGLVIAYPDPRRALRAARALMTRTSVGNVDGATRRPVRIGGRICASCLAPSRIGSVG